MANKERVLAYMEEHGSISSMEAFKDLGVTRLSAVIFDLRADGYEIDAKREKTVNRYGDKVSFARYTLRDKSAGAA